MPATSAVPTDPFSIAESESKQLRVVRRMMESGESAVVGPNGQRYRIPRRVYDLFLRILTLLEQGQAISIVPYMQDLTTQQAADLLGFSRQYLVRLLDAGKVPFHKVGSHRRIYLRDLLEFRKRRDAERHVALDRMARRDAEDSVYDDVILPDE